MVVRKRLKINRDNYSLKLFGILGEGFTVTDDLWSCWSWSNVFDQVYGKASGRRWFHCPAGLVAYLQAQRMYLPNVDVYFLKVHSGGSRHPEDRHRGKHLFTGGRRVHSSHRPHCHPGLHQKRWASPEHCHTQSGKWLPCSPEYTGELCCIVFPCCTTSC